MNRSVFPVVDREEVDGVHAMDDATLRTQPNDKLVALLADAHHAALSHRDPRVRVFYESVSRRLFDEALRRMAAGAA